MAKYNNFGRYQLGNVWIGQRSGSPSFYRCWLEGRTLKRVSLQTTDFEEAKQKLDAWWAEHYRLEVTDAPPSKVLLANVIDDYYNQHANKLHSAKTIIIMLRYWKEWWGKATVADVRSHTKQDDFRAHLAAKGLNPTSVTRCLEIGRAAIRRAWKRGALASVPHIEVPLIGETAPKGKPLTVEQIGKLLGGTQEPHMQLFILLMLGTAARPGALFELTWGQVDFASGLIRLNPEGRKQTSKRRPIVRMPETLKHVLMGLQGPADARVLQFRGKPIEKVDSGWHKMVKRAELGAGVTPYSIRHTCARWMRKDGVPMEQIASVLGHSMPGFSMSMRYTSDGPEYQLAAVKSLDALLALVLPAATRLVAIAEKKTSNINA